MSESDTDSEQQSEQAPLWRYVRLQQFTPPKPSAKETARKGFLGLRRRFTRDSGPDENRLIEEELQRLPKPLLDQIAPAPNWQDLQSALDETFQDWLNSEKSQNQLSALIAMPGDGQIEALTHWASSHNLLVLEPPTPKQILAGDTAWLDCLPQDTTTPMVVPSLTQFYLRHTDGLRLIRQFLFCLANWQGPCLVGCSSWAWGYLSKALGIDKLFVNTWTLQALNSDRLQAWFEQLADINEQQPVIFRQTDNGYFIIPPPALNDKGDDELSESEHDWGNWKQSSFLTDLAAYSRGNPEVAWAVWRQCLGQLSEEETAKHKLHEAVKTIWVKPWQDVRLPMLPNSVEHNELFILHTVLLHNELSTPLLCQLLPLSAFELQRTLTNLANLGILEKSQQRWRVNLLAYSNVRETLGGEGFLIDNPG